MKRRSLPSAAAFAAAAALLLTACGSDEEPKKDDKIAGADQDGSKSDASPSEESGADAAGAADRPKIELPADLTYTFDWPKTGDKAKDAVLADGEQFIKATDLAIVEQNPTHKAYRFYSEGELAATTETYVKEYVKAKARVTGSYRYYDAVVSADGDRASLSYCEDQGKAYDMYLKTDKVERTPATKNSYVRYNTALKKNDAGVWVTVKMHSQRGSSVCQP